MKPGARYGEKSCRGKESGKSSRGVGRELRSRALWAPHIFYSSKAARMASPPTVASSPGIALSPLKTSPGVSSCQNQEPSIRTRPWLLLQQTQPVPAFRRAVATELESCVAVAWISHRQAMEMSNIPSGAAPCDRGVSLEWVYL